jgi:2,3-bisphosphoglycerate-dependent phosphoglycerate mutase
MPEEPRPSVASYRQNRFPRYPGSVEIWLVRHGESEPYQPGSPFPMVDGHGDPQLCPEGQEQAERLAARLGEEHFDAIYVTGLRRTAQTAAPLAARLGLTPRVETGLREVRLGEWEGGLYRQKVAERDPVIRQAWAEERWDVIPGAEPAAELEGRVRAAIGRIAQEHPGGRVVVISHGGVIGQVFAIATGSRPFAFVAADNASVSRLVVAGDQWLVRGFNDTSHLDGLKAGPQVQSTS